MKRKLTAVLLSAVMIFSLFAPCAVFAEDVVTIALDESGVPKEASGTGWTYTDGTLTLSKGYSFEVDGACSVVVINYGTIEGGTFNNKVSNTGSTNTLNEAGGVINGGIFNGDVENYHGWNKCIVNGGTFNGKFTVGNHGFVNGGTFNGTYSEKLGYTFTGGTFKLIFETNGGEWKDGFEPPANYTYGNVTALPTAENIEKQDCNFLGWCTNSDLSDQAVSETSPTTHGIITYYAKYEKTVETWVNVAQKAVAGTDYSIDDDGNYTVFTAKGLAYVANIVNGGDDLEDKSVVLGDDIDLLDANLANYTIDNVDTQTSWIPMKSFAGTFDGNGKKIKNLFVVTEDKNAGLIGTNLGTIKNLEIESGKIEQKLVLESSLRAGSIAAYNAGVIENCVNRAGVTAESSISSMESVYMYVGGIVGSVSTSTVSPEYVVVRDCTNYGNVTYNGNSSLEADCGGIAGLATGGLVTEHGTVIENCKNNGDVSAEGCRLGRIGGIAGKATSSSSSRVLGMYIKKCANTGEVCAKASTNSMAGGVVGYGDVKYSYVYNSYNTGNVTSNKTAGGVIGSSKSTVENCYNAGEVVTTVSGSAVGGVIGSKSGGTVTNCYYLAGDETSVGGIKGKDVSGSAEGKTLAEFNSGTVCYLLNEERCDGLQVWFQTLGTDDYPVFKGETVCYDDENETYENKKIYTVEWSGPCSVATKGIIDLEDVLPEDVKIKSTIHSIVDIISEISPMYTPGGNGAKIGFKTVVFDEPTSGIVKVVFETENYGDITVLVKITLTGDYKVTISGLVPMDALYDGSVKYGYSGAPVGVLTDGTSYNGRWGVEYKNAVGNTLDKAPSEVGDYTVVFSVTSPGYKGSTSFNYSIVAEREAVYQAEADGDWIDGALTEALAKVYKGGTVKLCKDIDAKQLITVTRNVTLTSLDGENPVKIASSTEGHGYIIRVNATVVMENIIVDGGSEDNVTAKRALIMVDNGGNLTLKSGVTVKNNNNTTSGGAGGAVTVTDGKLTIDGAVISDNEAYSGGGVALVGANAEAEIVSGEIKNNKATCPNTQFMGGGAVYISSGGTFTMTGGTISDNSANFGAGVFVNTGSMFKATGGTMTSNTAQYYGGGAIILPNTTTEISGSPKIEGNTSGDEANNAGLYYEGSATSLPSVKIGALGTDAKIATYSWPKPEAGKSLVWVQPVEGYTITKDDLAKFSYGSSDYTLLIQSGNIVLYNGKTVTIDGEPTISTGYVELGIKNDDDTYSLPDNVLGYYIDEDFVDAGKYEVDGGEVIATVKLNVEVVNGAQVRYGGGVDANGKVGKGNGLRFIAQVDRSEFDGEGYGMKIEAEGSSVFTEIDAVKWQNAEETVFSVAITDMAVSNYNRNFTATPYVKVKYTDGTEKTVYGTKSVTRSIYYVATGLLKNGGTDEDYTLEENARLYDVLNAYVNMVGVRLNLYSDGTVTANTEKEGKYTGEAFFDVECVKNGDVYSVTVTPVTEGFANPVTIKDYWKEFVRINNNNSAVKEMIENENVDENGVLTFEFKVQ